MIQQVPNWYKFRMSLWKIHLNLGRAALCSLSDNNLPTYFVLPCYKQYFHYLKKKESLGDSTSHIDVDCQWVNDKLSTASSTGTCMHSKSYMLLLALAGSIQHDCILSIPIPLHAQELRFLSLRQQTSWHFLTFNMCTSALTQTPPLLDTHLSYSDL